MQTEFVQDRRKNRDRRNSIRTAVSGHIDLFLQAGAAVTIPASLIETSATGFRASHDSKALEPGLTVRFVRDGVSGAARVVWTHVLEGRRVSGFLVLEDPENEP